MKKEHGIFLKIFGFTMLLIVLMSIAAAVLFSRQFLSFYRSEQQRQLSAAFQPVINAIGERNNSIENILETAKLFADNNQSFRFVIQENDGRILFSTHGEADFLKNDQEQGQRIRIISMMMNQKDGTVNSYTFTGYHGKENLLDYRELIQRGFLALFFMLLIAIFGAFLFSFKITKPLEDEIRREHAMEENQRLFFSAASHELKTPIASARALVEGMIAGVGDYTDHPHYLRQCLKTLDSQGRLVSEILEIVKLSEKESELPLSAFDSAELINKVLSEYEALAMQKNLNVKCNLKNTAITADKNLLYIVLSNIIANAVQNSKENESILIETEEKEKKYLRFKITNTGARIPEEILPKLFDPFYRMDTARTKNSNQTGLGLAIVQKALNRMNFSFSLENTAIGVLFWIDIPL